MARYPKKKQEQENDRNLEFAYSFCEKIKQFEMQLKKEMTEHPDYRAECISIDHDLVYIVLKREANGVKYIQDVEVDLRAGN